MPLYKEVKIIKVPLADNKRLPDQQQRFPPMPRMYLEFFENKAKIKQDLINKEYVPTASFVDNVDVAVPLKNSPVKKGISSGGTSQAKPTVVSKTTTSPRLSSGKEDAVSKKLDKTNQEDLANVNSASISPSPSAPSSPAVSSSSSPPSSSSSSPPSSSSSSSDDSADSSKKHKENNDNDNDTDTDDESSSRKKNRHHSKKRKMDSDSDDDDKIADRLQELLSDKKHDRRNTSNTAASTAAAVVGAASAAVSAAAVHQGSPNNSRFADFKNRPRKSPPTLAELEARGQYQKQQELRDINHVPQNEIDDEDKKREIMFRFDILKKSYPAHVSTIPGFTIHSNLTEMQKTYDLSVRRLSLDSTVDSYKRYLTGGFMLVEFVFGKFLGMDMQGFTQQQIVNMHTYDTLLIELGEKSYVPTGSKWPVELRLLMVILMNAGFFLMNKMIMKTTGANLMHAINSLSGSSRPPSHNNGGNGGGGGGNGGGGGGGGNGGVASTSAQGPRRRVMKGPNIRLEDIPDVNHPDFQPEQKEQKVAAAAAAAAFVPPTTRR